MFRLFVFSRALFDYICVLAFFGLLGFAPTQQNRSIAVPHRTENAKQARGEAIFNLLVCLGRSDLCHGSGFFERYLTFDREAGSTDQSKAWTDECTNEARALDPLASRNRQGVGCVAPTLPELA